MAQRRSINSNSLQRNHNFINRAQFSVINVCEKQNWEEVLLAIKKNTKFQYQSENKIQVKKQTKPSVQYLKVSQCKLGPQSDNFKNGENAKEQIRLTIPSWAQQKIFNHLIKLVIVSCRINDLLFKGDQNNSSFHICFPNLEELDLSNNYLFEIPKCIYNCSKLEVVKLATNKITRVQSELAQMQKICSINLFSNQIQLISIRALTYFEQKKISFQLEWSPNMLIECLNISIQMAVGEILESVRTQGDYQPMDQNQQLSLPSETVERIKKSNNYLKISDSVKKMLQIQDTYDETIYQQVQRLIYYDSQFYLQYFAPYLRKNIRHFISIAFNNRKYKALDYILGVQAHIETNKQNLPEDHHDNTEQHMKKVQRQYRQNKLNHNMCSQLIEKKEGITKVQRIEKQENFDQNKNSSNNLKKQEIAQGKPREQFLIQKLVTFKVHHYKSIPLESIDEINIQKFLWLVNQLENVTVPKQELRAAFTTSHLHLLINKFVASDLDFEKIVNSSTSKIGIKALLIYSDVQFFANYLFQSVSILKIILSFEDFQLFNRFQKQYPSFVEALFKNNVRPISLAVSEKVSQINQISPKQTIFQQARQGTFWKYIVRPNSKLYKILYKKYKKYVKEHCTADYHKSWHFPEYIPPQAMIVRNDVHDYEILKDYEQFQASFYHKDLKIHVRKPSENYQYSIAKKIYMELHEKANSMIRNIGKTKEKSVKVLKEKNEGSILCSVPVSFDNSMMRQQESGREKHHLSCSSPSHKWQMSGKKKEEEEKVKKQRIKSIKCISGRKKMGKKKNGISILSNSEQRENKQNICKRTPNEIKFCYLDLSNRNRISVERNKDYDVVECSTFDLN